MSHILVATGVRREAATLARAGLVVVPGGGDPLALRARLEAAVTGATGVLSFGLAGALAEELRVGAWVVGTRVTGAVDLPCDPRWSDVLARELDARRGAVHADGRLVATLPEKRALAVGGAIAVDMESHVAAQVAAERALPFAIARCISDEARHAMPLAMLVAMRPDGGIDGGAMLRSLLRHPRQLPGFAGSVGHFLRALGALRRGADAIGPALSAV